MFSIHSKAQVSVEFIVLIGLAFLIAISFVVASLNQLIEFRNQQESDAVKDLALKLQQELLLASVVEEGYVRNFDIPTQIENNDYFLTLENSTVSVQSRNAYYLVSVPSVVGNFTKGNNKINKTGGVIYIN